MSSMTFEYIPVLDIFLAVLGFAISFVFCSAMCRACRRFREERSAERQQRGSEDGRPAPIYFIPFPGMAAQQRQPGEDVGMPPQYSQVSRSPQYSPAAVSGPPPPSYDELGLKPDDVPPAYSEFINVPFYSITPPTHTHSEMVPPQP